MKADSKSLVSSYKANPGVFFAVILGAISLIAFFVTGYIVYSDGVKDQSNLQQVAELRAQAYRLTALSRDATSGSEKGYLG
jgi:twitching motility protein PilJ